ncbi:sensor histidine kinase [Streptomyces virginiae]|uniref:sensor histidine kinase n=1 Tax=Streptomyces virginiae TaxID=1961 RepID=UPI00224FD514|nr:sensor domain-containing protein [Streptomyces virginiae]MCX4960305.1 sensor domain-containing protein [Streptomyces virginiae]
MTQADGRSGIGLRGALADLGRCQLLSLAALAVSGAGTLVVGALLLLPVGIGFLLLPPAAATLRRTSDRYRGWAVRWTGTVISPPRPLPPRPAPPENTTGRHRQARALLGDDGFWHDLRWAWAEPWTGALLAVVPLALVEYGLFGAAVQPFVWRLLGDGNWYAFILVDSTSTMLAALLLGFGFIAAGLKLAPATLRAHARWSRRLLAAPHTTELVRRIEHLAGSRADILDVQAAELRRIERDLHDGAQARLVALGMTLDEATRLLDRDLPAARALLHEVRATSQRALQDLRELVHGVLPPILADRGLGDAVRSLALDSHLDVHIETALPGRLPAPVESAGYFAVAELLANAAKHSGAPEVHIRLSHTDGALRATVTDEGRGGADPDGSGLQGVRRRLDPFDGTLVLHSPPGGPTTATLEIPCASSSPKTSSSSGTDSPAPSRSTDSR